METAEPETSAPIVRTADAPGDQTALIGPLLMGTLGSLVVQIGSALPLVPALASARSLPPAAHKAAMLAAFSQPATIMWTLITGCVSTVLLVTGVLGFRLPRIRVRLGALWPKVPALALVLALFALATTWMAVSFLAAILVAIHWLPPFHAGELLAAMSRALHTAPLPVAVMVALAGGFCPGIGEELMFRGFVQRGLLRCWSPAASILAASALFGLWHGSPVRILPAFATGCWLGWLSWRLDSIVPGMILHATLNTTFQLGGRFWMSTHPRLLGAYTMGEKAFGFVLFAACTAVLMPLVMRLLPARANPPTSAAAT